MKTINNELIRSFNPCYDPSEKNIPNDENLPVLEWVNKYRGIVPDKDIIWLLCRPEFMSDRDLRLFAVWCARDVLELVANPDHRSINACDVAEKFANGEATSEDLAAAEKAASAAVWGAAQEVARAADAAADAWAAFGAALAAWPAAEAAREAQLNKLLNYFK